MSCHVNNAVCSRNDSTGHIYLVFVPKRILASACREIRYTSHAQANHLNFGTNQDADLEVNGSSRDTAEVLLKLLTMADIRIGCMW